MGIYLSGGHRGCPATCGCFICTGTRKVVTMQMRGGGDLGEPLTVSPGTDGAAGAPRGRHPRRHLSSSLTKQESRSPGGAGAAAASPFPAVTRRGALPGPAPAAASVTQRRPRAPGRSTCGARGQQPPQPHTAVRVRAPRPRRSATPPKHRSNDRPLPPRSTADSHGRGGAGPGAAGAEPPAPQRRPAPRIPGAPLRRRPECRSPKQRPPARLTCPRRQPPRAAAPALLCNPRVTAPRGQ